MVLFFFKEPFLTKITHTMTVYSPKYLLVLLFFIIFASCDEDLPQEVRINKEIFTVNDQKELGDVFVKQYTKDHLQNILDRASNPQIYKYIDQFNTLFTTSPVTRLDDFDWDLTIVKDNSANAFTFPGGHIFITTGLLKFLDTESQLVAIIANEIFYSNSDVLVNKLVHHFQGIAMGDMLLGNIPEDYTPSEIVDYLIDVHFEEREVIAADKMALEIICPYQYDTSSLMHVIEKSKNGQHILWIERHPTAEQRMAMIMTMIQDQDCGAGKTFEDRYKKFKTLLH